MKNGKIQLIIVEDYAHLLKAKKVFDFCHEKNCATEKIAKLRDKVNGLLAIYDKIIFKLNMMDTSFLIFKKEITQIGLTKVSVDMVENCFIYVENIFKNLKTILKNLNLNDAEMVYLTKNASLE